MKEDVRIGVVSAIIKNAKDNMCKINQIISDYRDIIIARLGIPKKESDISIISLIVEGKEDKIAALAGKLGNLPNVSTKSILNKFKK